ncbi:MAG: gliding motility lipoprotein GldH [Bacteroidia bacterium]|jgi:gliding motility-associated lipoprotein GldH
MTPHFPLVRQTSLLLSGLVVALCVSCSPSSEFEAQVLLPPQGWEQRNSVVFRYDNQDSLNPFQLGLHIRHEGDYPYRNVHTLCEVSGPDGDSLVWKNDIPLTDQEGRWLGQSALGDLYSVTTLVQDSLHFKRKGLYTFRIRQNMRLDPLPSVVEVGWVVARRTTND